MGFECPVCLESYDLKTREPKVLRCSHTVCSECVNRLVRGDSVTCPTCRRTTQLKEISINFGLRDGIAEQCEECRQETRSQTCRHCGRDICDTCLKAHVVLYRSDLKIKIDTLRAELLKATNQSMDQSVTEKENMKAESEISHIRASIGTRTNELEELGKELEKQVRHMSDSNITIHEEWVNNFDVKLNECKLFIRRVQDKMTLKHIDELTVERITTFHRECGENLHTLTTLQNSVPTMKNYRFSPSPNVKFDVGDIVYDAESVCESKAGLSKGSNDRRPTDDGQRTANLNNYYKHMENKATVDFNMGDMCVAFMNDRVYISDTMNHRLKLFDSNLDLKSITGKKGKGWEDFNGPWSICVINEELFISDRLNDRIKVYDKYCQVLRIFGKKGDGKAKLKKPMGIAGGPNNLVYVCDSENYRIQIFDTQGSYVSSIGHKGVGSGAFSEPPHTVAVTSAGTVLVIDMNSTNVHMFSSNTLYMGLLINRCNPLALQTMCLQDIAIDREDNILITDSNGDRILVLNLDGTVISTIGKQGNGPGDLRGPRDIAVNQSGEIVVLDALNTRLHVFGVKKAQLTLHTLHELDGFH